MAHNHLYSFRIDKGRVLQFKNKVQIARLHSFSSTKENYNIPGITKFYKNILACSNHEGSIVVINIFTRVKKIILLAKTQLSTLTFLDENNLVSTTVDGLVKVHSLQTLKSYTIIGASLLSLFKNKTTLNLQEISTGILSPLIASNSFHAAYSLIDDNPWLKESTEYLNIENIYKTAFCRTIDALCQENTSKAKKLLEKFENIKSKEKELKALFVDFKHYDRFKLHIKDKKYTIAYAISSKHPALKLSKEFIQLQEIYTKSFHVAQNQIKTGQKELAKESLGQYLSVLSKRDEIKKLLEGADCSKPLTKEEELHQAYQKNNFRKCYELIDSHSLQNSQLISMLESHWEKLMHNCEDYALRGDIKAIKKSLGELITTKTRLQKIGELLRLAFYSKINTLQYNKNFQSAENIIYSYIDIFGIDLEISDIMKKFAKRNPKGLAISQTVNQRVSRDNWLYTKSIVED